MDHKIVDMNTSRGNKSDIEDRKVSRVLITYAKPGMEVARDIYSRNDQVILNKGSVLDASKIAKIMFYSVDSIYVYEEDSEALSYTEQLMQSDEFKQFKKSFDDTIESFRQSINDSLEGDAEVEEEFLFSEVEKIIKTTGSNKYVFDMIFCMRSYDEQTYVHSLDVALICNCFAKWLGMSDESIRVVTLGGLLHDIGKIKVPQSILNKPGKLTKEEYEIMKTHTLKGYEILSKKKIDERIKRIVLEHHERCDRTGYPYGKSGDEIEPFAMICAIADVYDAMTSDRVYRPGICPFKVVKLLESEGKQQYDPRFLIPLLEQITEVYIHHTVRLSDDSVGQVIMINRNELSKPVIQIGADVVDLSKRRDLSVSEVL